MRASTAQSGGHRVLGLGRFDLVLGGCAGNAQTGQPQGHGSGARQINSLSSRSGSPSPSFALVGGAMVTYAVIRFRASSADERPQPDPRRQHRLE